MTVTFTFDGTRYQAQPGDTLATALLRNGIVHVTDSAYRDRPRGIIGDRKSTRLNSSH